MNPYLLAPVLGLLVVTGEKPEFEAPFRVMDGESWINVEIGHAAPLMLDWDGDALDDLLVGQFGEGRLRIYMNRGRKDAPRFSGFSWFETKAGLGTIPSG